MAGSGEADHGGTEFLTAREVADRLRVSTMTVYRLIKAGTLPSTRVGQKGYRIRGRDLEDFLAASRT